MRTLAIGFALALIAAPASAQAQTDRWTPWLGCWDLVLENAREGTLSADTARDPAPRPRPRDTSSSQPRVCVERAPGGGATFRTTIGTTQTPIAQTLIADGASHPIADGECTGTQRVEWSKDGLRLYSNAELTCKGDPGTRRVSGYALLGPNATWTDVQSIDLGGRDSYRVRRYRRVETTPNERAQGARLSIDDVKEATGKVTSQAIEAAMVETNASFPLTSRRLLELSDAKVSPNVIDLMVALSYPKRFVVERARADRAQTQITNDPFGLGWAFGQPVWSDDFGFYSPLYGPYSSYYYSPFSYGYLNYSPYFNGAGYFTVIDGDGGGGGRGPQPSGLGRVVDGQGYTRVRPRESEPTAGTHSTAATASGSASAPSSGGSSGGSTVTSQGFSSGGSSGGSSSSGGGGGDSGGGRTAVPR
jgi:hypothetical protein